MRNYDTHYDRPTAIVVVDIEGSEIARAETTRFIANEFTKSIDGSLLVLGAKIFGGKFDRYIPMHRIAEIQVGR